MDIKAGHWYSTTAGDVMVTGQAVPRQRAGVYDFNVRDRKRRILFSSRSREEALQWVANREVQR